MRLAVLGGLLAALFTSSFAVSAQEFGKDRKEKSSQIQEVGGKTIEQWIKDISGKDRSAMNALIPVVKDAATWEVRWAAAAALGTVSIDLEKKEGPTLGALNALYYALTDSSARVRMAAIQSLTIVGRAASPEYKKA